MRVAMPRFFCASTEPTLNVFAEGWPRKTGIAIVYDGDGSLVSETVGSTTTKYLVDDKNPTGYSQVMDEIVNGAVTRTYTYGRQLISENQLVGSTWTPSFYGYDGHGNARFLANSAGTITDTYTFDAFGDAMESRCTRLTCPRSCADLQVKRL